MQIALMIFRWYLTVETGRVSKNATLGPGFKKNEELTVHKLGFQDERR